MALVAVAAMAALLAACTSGGSELAEEVAPLAVEGVEAGTLIEWTPWTAATADLGCARIRGPIVSDG